MESAYDFRLRETPKKFMIRILFLQTQRFGAEDQQLKLKP